MVLLNGFDRSVSDILDTGYVYDSKWKIDVKHGEPSPVLQQFAQLSQKKQFAATTSIQHTFPWGSLEGKFGTKLSTASIRMKPKMMPGVILGAQVERQQDVPKGPIDSAKVSMEYQCDKGHLINTNYVSMLIPHISMSMDPSSNAWTVNGTTGLQFTPNSILRFGGQINGISYMKNVECSAGASFSQIAAGKTWTTCIKGAPSSGVLFGKLTGSVYCKSLIPGAPSLAARVTHCDSKTNVAFSGQWDLNGKDQEKANTILKVKLTQDAKIGMAFIHDITKNITATVATQFDVLKPEEIKYGLALNVTL